MSQGRLWPGVAGGVWLRIPSGAQMLCWKLWNLLPHCFSRPLSTTLLCGRQGDKRQCSCTWHSSPPGCYAQGSRLSSGSRRVSRMGSPSFKWLPWLWEAVGSLAGRVCLLPPPSSSPLPLPSCTPPKVLLTSLRLHHFPQQCLFAISRAKPGCHCEFHIKFLYVVF